MNLCKSVLFLGGIVAALPCYSKVVTKPVDYTHDGVALQGWLAYDDSFESRRPGVLVIPEWWGLGDYVKGRAEQLAKMGYVAFAVDMYGKGVVTTDPKRAGELSAPFYGKPLMAERARAGLDQLLASDRVDKDKVAAIGFCFGGAVAQALAYSGAPIQGIVSFHGSLIPAPAGAPNKIKFLMQHGAADGFEKPEDIVAFKKSLTDGGFDWQWIEFAGAVHAFTNPGADKYGVPGVSYNETAAKRSWRYMKVFFNEIFGDMK